MVAESHNNFPLLESGDLCRVVNNRVALPLKYSNETFRGDNGTAGAALFFNGRVDLIRRVLRRCLLTD